MPIDSPHLFKPHEPSQDWRRLSEWEAPKIPLIESRTELLTPLYGQSQGIESSAAITSQSSSVLATVPRQSSHPTLKARTQKLKPKPATQSSVRVCPANGKGQGIFAIKSIQAGTTILRERPFITFQDPLTSLEVYNASKVLSRDSRDIFWSFSGRGSHTPPDVDIAETNLSPLEGDEACGMFVTICRINHCCSPNARWIWSSKEGKMGQY